MLARVLDCVQTMTSMEATPKPVHVLAIDDDPLVRQMIADYLTDNDIEVTVVGSGREIAEVMARHTIDLLLLDLKLPGEDGMQIARNLRAESDARRTMRPYGTKKELAQVTGTAFASLPRDDRRQSSLNLADHYRCALQSETRMLQA